MGANNVTLAGYNSYAAVKTGMGGALTKATEAAKAAKEKKAEEAQAAQNGTGVNSAATTAKTSAVTKANEAKASEKTNAVKAGEKTSAAKTSEKTDAAQSGKRADGTGKTSETGAAAVYEPNKTNEAFGKLSEDQRRIVAENMKAVQDAQTQGIRDMVQRVMSQQSNVWQRAVGAPSAWEMMTTSMAMQGIQGSDDHFGLDDDAWEKFTSGNFSVDAATKKQAQDAISDNGYWGVEQTSDRIVKFARALAGDDPEKLEQMEAAFEKGYQEAMKSWGKDLPEISQKTREATLEKFKQLKEQAGITAT